MAGRIGVQKLVFVGANGALSQPDANTYDRMIGSLDFAASQLSLSCCISQAAGAVAVVLTQLDETFLRRPPPETT